MLTLPAASVVAWMASAPLEVSLFWQLMSHLVDASLWLQLCKKTIHELYILKSVPKSAEFAFHGQECWQFQAYPTSSTYYTKYMCDFNKKFNCLFGNGIEHWLTSPRSEIKHCIASKKWVATIRANKQSWHIFHTPSNHYTFNILPDEYLVFQRCQTGSINVIRCCKNHTVFS